MADLYSSTSDGSIYSAPNGTWANSRDDTSGIVTATTSNSFSDFTSVSKFSSRGGGNTYKITRTFMWFDTSGITGTVTSATIKIHGYTANDGSIIPVKSTAFGGDGGTALATGDINAITGYSSGSSLAGNATTYGPRILTTNWSTSAYNDFAGTSDLKTDMQNNDVVIICFMDYTHDYLNSAPSSSGTFNCGGYYTDYGGTDHDPYISYAETAGSPDNSFQYKVNGLIGAATGREIQKISGVLKNNNIREVIGVD